MAIFDYRLVTVASRRWPGAADAIMTTGRANVEAAGGQFYGLWTGIIGFARDEGVLMTIWPDEDSARAHGAVGVDVPNVQSSFGHVLHSTVRPVSNAPPSGPGVYAHRWFDIGASDWPEFLALSDRAWPHMEAAYDVNIIGFWRSAEVREPQAKVLLMTRYADLSVWEASRWWGSPKPEAEGASTRFETRGELTRSTVVNVAKLVTYES